MDCWKIFHAFKMSSADFLKYSFSNNSFMNTIRVSKSLDPYYADILSGLIWVNNS